METLTDILKVYFKSKSEVAAAYLFGSHARGKEQPSSDIDVAVLFSKNDRGFCLKKRDALLLELARITRKDLDVMILNTANLTLLRQVFSKGICLAANHQKQLALFRMIAFAEIADFAYYRAMMEPQFVRKVLEE